MKKVYVSFPLHGNMCYDRYPRQLIRGRLPLIYASGIRAMQRFTALLQAHAAGSTPRPTELSLLKAGSRALAGRFCGSCSPL